MSLLDERRGLSPPTRFDPIDCRWSAGINPAARRFIAIALLLATSTARAQSPPYGLDLVILRSDHRLLATEAFRERFPRRLANEVRLALDPLVQVTTTETCPNAETLRRDGLEVPLDASNAVTDRRTGFLRLRYDAGEFVAEYRSVDGYTGLVSPRVVTARTGDRDRLVTLATGLVSQSFAGVGDVGNVEGDHAENCVCSKVSTATSDLEMFSRSAASSFRKAAGSVSGSTGWFSRRKKRRRPASSGVGFIAAISMTGWTARPAP